MDRAIVNPGVHQNDRYKLIPHNHVALKAPAYLYQAMMPLLEGTPLHPVALEDFHASLYYSKVPLKTFTPDPDKEYDARIVEGRVWFDSYMGVSNLVVLLLSEDMEARHKDIEQKYNGVFVYRKYVPHVTVSYDLPPFSRKRKAFINAFSDYVHNYLIGESVTFTGEYLESTSGVSAAKKSAPQQAA